MGSNILVDWITFSTRIHDLNGIVDFLGLTEQEFKKASGRYFYGCSWRFGNISIYTDGLAPDMGVCVEMSGQGCRDFETFGTGDWHSIFLLYMTHKEDINISRLDIACDDFDGVLDLDSLVNDTLSGYFTSKNKHWNIQKGSRGLTVEHGDRGGSCFIRIYDKKAERKRKDIEYWARCEIQLRDKLPGSFVDALLTDNVTIQKLYFEVLNNYLRYIKPCNDSNKRRWDTADHWLRFLQTAEKRSIFVSPGVNYNLLGLQHYVIDTAGNAIKTYIDIMGLDSFLDYLSKLKKSKNPKYDYLRRMARIEGLINE